MTNGNVKIPKSFSEKIDRLGPHFCLVKARDKDPSIGGKGWQLPENLMYSSDPKLLKHLGEGGNYGVVAHGHLIIIDTDDEETKQAVLQGLPKTLTVKSPGSGGFHFYFLCGDLKRKYVLVNGDGENIGNVQGDGKMCVGPGSIHPNGGIYEVISDLPIARITDEQIRQALGKFIQETEKSEEAAEKERKDLSDQGIDSLDITDVVPLNELRRMGDEYYGSHPVHGSKTGRNFWVNPSKNVWHCFRCGSGGGPLLWLAVRENIIDCRDARPGVLRGELFHAALKCAAELGLVKPEILSNIEKNTSASGDEKFTPEFWRKAAKVWVEKDIISYLEEDLDRYVKRDRAVKLSVFITGVSAYLPEPINLFLKGESGVGKSYNTMQALRYFPDEDVWPLIGMSRTALVHDYGALMNKHGKPIDFSNAPTHPRRKDYASKEEYEEALSEYKRQYREWVEELRQSYNLIDLSWKILVFLESPSPETFRMLYPVLSHDTRRYEYRFTDRDKKGGPLKQVRVVLQGWPATIFLSTDRAYMEEMSTRSFTATPEASAEKIEAANQLTNLKTALPFLYGQEPESTLIIRQLIRNIKKAFSESSLDILVPFTNLYEMFPKEIVRDMRDFQHFIQFLKTVTALHLFQRPIIEVKGKRYLVSSINDVKTALSIYSEIFETTRTGTEERILKFYHEIVKSEDRWFLQGLVTRYNEKAEKKVSSETIRVWLQRLAEIGYVDIQKDTDDKRLNVYIPLVKEGKSKISLKLENWKISEADLRRGFKEWLEKIQQAEGSENNMKFSAYKILDENRGTWTESEIAFQEFTSRLLGDSALKETENFSLLKNPQACRIFSETENNSKDEEKPEKEQKEENREFLENSRDNSNIIGLAAESCVWWRTRNCPTAVPSAIFPNATCPRNCRNYRPRDLG